MKRLGFAATTLALMALAACGRDDQDQLNATDTNASIETLDELSDDAANVAAEAAELKNQAAQLNQEAQAIDEGGTETPADENIAGM